MAATLALGASLIVGGCGGSNTAERPKDEIVYVNFRDTRDLNPHLFAGEMYAQKLLYDTLITINPDGTYAPSLATSWEISPDGLTYTFKIREGVKFTDGEVCDAQAILANFNALNGFKERYKWMFLQVLDHFEVPDNNTFVIKLKEPRGAMMTELGVLRPFAMCSPKVMKNGLTKDGVTDLLRAHQSHPLRSRRGGTARAADPRHQRRDDRRDTGGAGAGQAVSHPLSHMGVKCAARGFRLQLCQPAAQRL